MNHEGNHSSSPFHQFILGPALGAPPLGWSTMAPLGLTAGVTALGARATRASLGSGSTGSSASVGGSVAWDGSSSWGAGLGAAGWGRMLLGAVESFQGQTET